MGNAADTPHVDGMVVVLVGQDSLRGSVASSLHAWGQASFPLGHADGILVIFSHHFLVNFSDEFLVIF